jgi:hypothetical protein
VESPAITIEPALSQTPTDSLKLKEPMAGDIVCIAEKSDITQEHARQYTLKESLESLDLMEKESVANVGKLDTIPEPVPSYFQTELKKIIAVPTESAHNVERRGTIRGLVRQSIPRLLLREN